MKWYFASRMCHRETIQSLRALLEKYGHEFSFDWSSQPSLKPYKDHPNECRQAAETINKAIKDTDVFVLISDEAGTDMFIELGLAIKESENRKMTIYNVGPFNQRSLMQFHIVIKQVKNLEDIFNQHLPEAVPEIKALDKKLEAEFSGE